MIHTAAISLADVAVGIELAIILALACFALWALKQARWFAERCKAAQSAALHAQDIALAAQAELLALPKRAPNGRLVSRRVKA